MKIVIDIPKRSAAALAVAISNHAHSLGMSFQGTIGQKPKDDDERRCWQAWGQHAIALQSAKVQVKRQAGIK